MRDRRAQVLLKRGPDGLVRGIAELAIVCRCGAGADPPISSLNLAVTPLGITDELRSAHAAMALLYPSFSVS